jgi:glutaredoxin
MRRFWMVTGPNCPWCTRARNLLEAEGHSVSEVGRETQMGKTLMLANDQTTVPLVVEIVGGYEKLEAHLAAGVPVHG